MDKDNWWEDLKLIIRETRENMNKIDSRSGKDTFFYDRGRIEDFQNSETLRKLREYEMELREMMMKPTEQNVVTLNQPITPRVFRKNDYENEFFDYIFKHLSQGMNERNIITRLLAEIKDDLKSIIKFNQNEKKKLNDLETEEFIKSQESRLWRESKDIGTNNVGDIETIADGLKMVAEKLSNVEAQNEDVMRRLDRIYENLGEQKSGSQRALMDELRGIVKTLNNLSDKSNFARHISAKEFKEVHPVRLAPVELPQKHHRGKDDVVGSLSSSFLDLPWEFKTKQQLLWEYEENKRQLKLLEKEGFQSPDFLRRGYHGRLSPFFTSEAGGYSKAKSNEYSTSYGYI